MKPFFIWYPKCTTCQNAKKWLDENHIEYVARHIVEETPTQEELSKWVEKSQYPIRKFFNTSGLQYKALGLKDKMENLSDEEKIELLSSNGMLIKRPLYISDDVVLVAFSQKEWEEKIQ